MLYDNALLAQLYLRAASAFAEKGFATIAYQTLDFVVREMRHTGGGYVASLSAFDDQNVEGGYYLWRADELADALSAEHYAAINRYWSLDTSATFAAGYLPQMIPADAMPTAKAARQILAAKRNKHRRLPRDEKRITAWNALLLSAFVKAAKSGAIRFAKHAHALRQFLHNDSKLLARSVIGPSHIGDGELEDYAYRAQALWDYGRWRRSKADKAKARELASTAWQRFATARGWRSTASSALPFESLDVVVRDGPLPSPSATLIDLSLNAGDTSLAASAREVLYRQPDTLRDALFHYATHVDVLRRHDLRR